MGAEFGAGAEGSDVEPGIVGFGGLKTECQIWNMRVVGVCESKTSVLQCG